MISTSYFGPKSFPVENRAVGDFVSRVIWGKTGEIRDYCSAAMFDDGVLIAGVLYHNYQPESGVVELSTGSQSKRWLNRTTLRAIFDLPFRMLGCRLCVLRVSERNTVMCSIARRVGFDEYRIPELRGPGEAEMIYTMTAEQWARGPVAQRGVI